MARILLQGPADDLNWAFELKKEHAYYCMGVYGQRICFKRFVIEVLSSALKRICYLLPPHSHFHFFLNSIVGKAERLQED